MDYRFLRDDVVNLARYLPDFLSEDPAFKNTLTALGTEHEKLRQQIMDLAAQAFVTTATWGLADWELILGLVGRPGATIEDRRNRILLYLQSSQTVTKEFMTRLVRRYCEEPDSTDIEIVEDNEHYAFQIRTTGGWFINMDDLREAVELYKPAHLGYTLVPILLMRDTVAMSSLHQSLLELTGFIERYSWRGRYANGAYLAMAPVMADGEYIADGTLIANGALPNREENYYFPYIADGEYIADGTLTADCAHQTGAIYADSLEPDLLNVCGMVVNTDTYSVLLYADGKWMADGTILAGYNTHCQEAPIAIDAQETLNDSERMTDNQAITLGLCEQENSPLANMYYADGTWAAGPALEADGSYIADGEILANGLSALHSQYTAPVICDGTYLADGTRLPAARPLAGTAESDENKNESLSMFQRMAASDAVSAAEADDVDVDIAAHDWLDNGHQANGEYTANGAIVGAGHATGDAITTSSTLRISDSIISTYYADGENMADGHIKGGETEGARDSMTVTVGLGRLADGSALANAGGAIYADGSYIADGAYTAMQFRLARHTADGSILADGSHIPGRGGDLCDYTYFAA